MLDLSYSFGNSLIRDVVYGLMLFSQRRQVHKSVASYYQDKYEGNFYYFKKKINFVFLGNSFYYPFIAFHSKQAEDYETALNYFTKSGSSGKKQLIIFKKKIN